jgi:hypothetical protein
MGGPTTVIHQFTVGWLAKKASVDLGNRGARAQAKAREFQFIQSNHLENAFALTGTVTAAPK